MRTAVLFVPFFTPKDHARQSELLNVLEKNSQLNWLEKVVLMIDDDTFSDVPPPSKKIIIERFSRRPQYADWIRLSALHANDKQLSICANADIELLSDFLSYASKELLRPKTLLCITRYELSSVKDPKLRENPHWTQDTWCLTGHEAAELEPALSQELRFPFGVPRCDNRIPYAFWLRNWNIINPCQRIVTLHHHKETSRSYSKKDTTILGGALFIHPSEATSKPSQLELHIFSINESDPSLIKHNKFLGTSKQSDDPKIIEGNTIKLQICAKQKLLMAKRQLLLVNQVLNTEWTEVHRYNQQFKVYRKDSRLAFVDTEWPSVLVYSDPGFENLSPEDRRKSFFWGFCAPVTEFIPNHFCPKKIFNHQQNFWQYPCRTEQDAYERHLKIEAPVFSESAAHTYIGLPWATWIDKKEYPSELLNAFGRRISSVRSFLERWNITLEAHSVCQHIRWKGAVKTIERAGINHLWIAHKEKGWDTEGQLRLHSWPLYAVNVLDQERREGLEIVPVEQKTVFASFKGAHMKHYPSEIRLRLKELAHLEGYEIEVTDLWHFNKVVYNYQIANKEADKKAIEQQDTINYNRLLSKSLFSLCPSGAGPNTLRLWESLGVGAIPVVISDLYEPPQPFCDSENKSSKLIWEDACITIKERHLNSLPQLLESIPHSKLVKTQETALRLFSYSLSLTCFGEQNPESRDSTPLLNKAKQERHLLLDVFKSSQRIAVLGSSLSIQRKGYLPRLVERLDGLIEDYQSRHHILNASLGGTNVYATLSYACSDSFYPLKDFKPTVAIIEKAPNNRINSFASLDNESRSAEVSSTINSLRRLIRYLRSIGCETVICLTSFIEDPLIINWSGESMNSSYLAYIDKKACEHENAFHLNVASVLSIAFSQKITSVLLDDVHVNDDGAAAYSEAIIGLMSRSLTGEMGLSPITPINPVINTLTDQYPRIVFPREHDQKDWQSNIISTRYIEIKSQITIHLPSDLPNNRCITGIFFIADPMSPVLRIDSDSDDPYRICLFDHYCYMQRVHFRLTRPIRVDSKFVISLENEDIDYQVAINQFRRSKTFDPESKWAQDKYLYPLLKAKDERVRILKLIGFVCDVMYPLEADQ